MLTEIIRELTKTETSTAVTSELVLVWEKKVEAQKAQSTIITSLRETKEFDKIKTIKEGETESKKTANMCHNAFEADFQFLWFQPSTQTMPSLWEDGCGVQEGQPLYRGQQKWNK